MTAPHDNPKPAAPDWERIELDYRAGLLSLREIAEMHPGVSHMTIARMAKRNGWARDLSAKIHAKADDLVTRQAVTVAVTANGDVTERQVIDAGAAAIVQVRLSHRADIRRSRAIVMSMLDELELTCGPENAALLAELGELMYEPDERGQDKRKDLFDKLLSLNGRSVTMKNLAESLKGMVALEREAFSLNAAPTGPANPLEAFLSELSSRGSRLPTGAT